MGGVILTHDWGCGWTGRDVVRRGLSHAGPAPVLRGPQQLPAGIYRPAIGPTGTALAKAGWPRAGCSRRIWEIAYKECRAPCSCSNTQNTYVQDNTRYVTSPFAHLASAKGVSEGLCEDPKM